MPPPQFPRPEASRASYAAPSCSRFGVFASSAHVDPTRAEPAGESRPAAARALSAAPEEARVKRRLAAETFAGCGIEGKAWTDADHLNVRILQRARAAELSKTSALPSLKNVHAFQIRWRPQVVQWIGDVRHPPAARARARALAAPNSETPLAVAPQVCSEFDFDLETKALAFHFFDRVLTSCNLSADIFQTASFACLFIGAQPAKRAHARVKWRATLPHPRIFPGPAAAAPSFMQRRSFTKSTPSR